MNAAEGTKRSILRVGWDAVLRLLYPPKCMFCGKLLEGTEQGACSTCRAELPWTTGASARRAGTCFSHCVSPFFLEGRMHTALLAYKYHQRESYGVCFGQWMGACARRYLSGPFDLITWVPVSRKRLRERGFDQCELLAAQVARAYQQRPVRTLRKVKHIPALATTEGGKAVRQQLVSGVYQAVAPQPLTGKRILLVDDIITTGSTLEEAARTLLYAGAAEVCCVTVARTPPKERAEQKDAES